MSESSLRNRVLKPLGAVLFLAGVAFAVYYLDFFDTSISTTTGDILIRRSGGEVVYDPDLARQRQAGLTLSSIVAVAGLILVGACEALGRRRQA